MRKPLRMEGRAWLLGLALLALSGLATSSQLRSKSITVDDAVELAEHDGFRPMPQPLYQPQQQPMQMPQMPLQQPMVGQFVPGYGRQMVPGEINFGEQAAAAAAAGAAKAQSEAASAEATAAQAGATAAAAGNGAGATGMSAILDRAKAQETQHSSLMNQVQSYIDSEKTLANQLAGEIRQKAAKLSKLISNLQGEGAKIKRTTNTLSEKKEMEAQLRRQMARIEEQIQKLNGEVQTDNGEAIKDKKSESATKGELAGEDTSYNKMLQMKQQYENDILTLRSEYRKVQGRYKALTTIPIAAIKVDKFAMGDPSEDPGMNFKDKNGYYQDGLKDSLTHPPDISHPPEAEEPAAASAGGSDSQAQMEMDELPPQGRIRPGEH